MAEPEHDAISGKTTTGHEWDGIKELNTPLPRWWLWTFYATIVWAIGYTIVYPSWPTLGGYFHGVMGYSSRMQIADTMAKVKEARRPWTSRFAETPVEEIVKNPDLLRYAMAGGRVVFGENCAPCHGSGGAGTPGFPVLADDDWLWGGDIANIYTTVRFGIRSGHDEARMNEMPKFGGDDMLTPQQIDAVAKFVLSLSGEGDAAQAGEGAQLFADNCAACHGDKGKGLIDLGGPNLTDGIWLYGSGLDAIKAQIKSPRHGVMPAWVNRLDDVAIKMVSVYVHALGGGK